MTNKVRFFTTEDDYVIATYVNSVIPYRGSTIFLCDEKYKVDDILFYYPPPDTPDDYFTLVDIFVHKEGKYR